MTCLISLETSYSKKELTSLAINFLKRYSSQDANYSLKRIFSSVFHEDSSLFFPNGDMHLVANDLMVGFYHNEAFIKSSFLKKELWTGHHVCIYEYPVNNSRADLVKIDKVSCAYEIKTDYDNTNRLKRQLLDYSRAFEYIYVVCSQRNLSSVERIAGRWVGIYLYEDRPSSVSFSLYRQAERSPNIDGRVQLRSLSDKHQKLYLAKSSCLSLTEAVNNSDVSSDINEFFKAQLKKKYHDNWLYLKQNASRIRPIDYQWSYKFKVNPSCC